MEHRPLESRAGFLTEAHELVETMPMEPNTQVLGALLGGCMLHKNADLASLVAQKLTDALEPDQAARYLVLLSNVYARANRWLDVAYVRQKMVHMGVKKPPPQAEVGFKLTELFMILWQEQGKQMTDQAMSKQSGTSIDRSQVKILLCDRNAESSEEVSTLLTACCYQVVSVSSAVKVVDALNAEWSSIDIILASIDLPLESSTAMVKYIMQDQHFKCIPVIILSTNHESSCLVNFLRLGATDYLVKPLCIDEILNLWMHSWKQPKVLDWLPQNDFHATGDENMNIFVCNDIDEEFVENTRQKLYVSRRN